jgi:hypothetical protein
LVVLMRDRIFLREQSSNNNRRPRVTVLGAAKDIGQTLLVECGFGSVVRELAAPNGARGVSMKLERAFSSETLDWPVRNYNFLH